MLKKKPHDKGLTGFNKREREKLFLNGKGKAGQWINLNLLTMSLVNFFNSLGFETLKSCDFSDIFFPHKCIYFPSVKYIPFHKDWDINIIYEVRPYKARVTRKKNRSSNLVAV